MEYLHNRRQFLRAVSFGAASLAVQDYIWGRNGVQDGLEPDVIQGRDINDILHGIIADYNAEIRRAGGRVDIDAMVARLSLLRINTYFWLIWHASTDWDDLKLFLPEAAKANINVWVYLVPPSESPPRTGLYSEPFRLDYFRWAEEIAKLSLRYPNLTAWVIDDFYYDRKLFTTQYVHEMQRKAKQINSSLAFLPLMYFPQMTPDFINQYRDVIDGVVVAYPQDEVEIEVAWMILNNVFRTMPGQIRFPKLTPSQMGDFVTISQTAAVEPANRYFISFREQDDFTGETAGYHFKQLLVDDVVVWEQDVAGGTPKWHEVVVDVKKHVEDKDVVRISFRLLDKKGVSNFGVRWLLHDVEVKGLQPAADLSEPQNWQVSKRGAFEAGFGDEIKVKAGSRQFHLPFIVMTAASVGAFRKRHGEPATPEHIAQWLEMCLQTFKAGKCDGVVTYCLDKRPHSPTFQAALKVLSTFLGST